MEETRLFQRQSIEHVHSLEEPGVQFGSLDFASLSSCEGSTTRPKSHNSSIESKSVLVSNIISDLTCKNASTKVNRPQKGTGNQTNGETISYGQNDEFMEKEKDTLGLMSLHITEREAADSDLSVAPKVQEGWIQASKANNIPKTLTDKRVNVKSILPRGLINSKRDLIVWF
ncbi:ubiquitin carboxyl-terminal hydrolase 24-like isoform X2 [Canna indica]|uniref:Ubiquitin carboxyl-terminal hydrolase 24-like isoform X2 n=1 Tax=Canna indica TaxID=4628 RepID=A0AAQ3PY10_9LILI|nr:ubiquitin carboxyl-terminal hydrolase 24-like isoform X2 [Canna indica]